MADAGWTASTRDRQIDSSLVDGLTRGCGWAAVAAVRDDGARLSRVVAGAPDETHPSRELFLGLQAHAAYDFQLADINETLLEIKPDVNWAAFQSEVEHYARAAGEDKLHPLLHLALAALLVPWTGLVRFIVECTLWVAAVALIVSPLTSKGLRDRLIAAIPR